ncbi:hypothetical protein GBF38_016368 [Nibea albiflora]|uniref:Uncharacterized protein n=1 Tax=Nibea albiflora TaxID=240163 RepID=A0ACB7FLS5_NIBAL|nr:hypothetical protein GBF38_016368 [Nibea albiflora]
MQPVTRMTAATAANGGRERGREDEEEQGGFEHSAQPKTITYAPPMLDTKTGRGANTEDARGIQGFILCLVSALEKHGTSDRKRRRRNMKNETRGNK